MTRAPVPAAALAALALAACDGPPDTIAADAGPPTVALGTGEQSFEPLADGGTLRAYAGPQGGFHVFLTVRTTGLHGGDPDESPLPCDAPRERTAPCVDLVVADATGPIDLYAPLRIPLVRAPDGRLEPRRPRLVQLDIGDLAEVDGLALTVSATVSDVHGAEAAATLRVTGAAAR